MLCFPFVRIRIPKVEKDTPGRRDNATGTVTPCRGPGFPRLAACDPLERHIKEEMVWLRLLDIGFFAFHTALVLFNITGWAWRRTRRWNLALLLATAASWFIMGIWYGPGYCFCTDLHWRVRAALGYANDSPTYIHLLIRTLTGVSLPVHIVEVVTAAGLAFSLLMSLAFNIRDFRQNRRALISS